MAIQDNILLFITYSIIVALILNLIHGAKIKTAVLFGTTVFFYLSYSWKYSLLLVATVVWTYVWGIIISSKIDMPKRRTYMLLGALLPIVSLLVIFKWANQVLNSCRIEYKLILPLGLSYYSFKAISYLIDVYRDPDKVEKSVIILSNYIAFFPQIICGPISRIDELGSQLRKMNRAERSDIEAGIYFICSGLFKKIVIADRMVNYTTTIFANHNSYPAMALWMSAFFYTIEIYCDFAGYSEIVIGVCRLMGIQIKDNFIRPYFAYGIADFWHRWHISLSSWLKDYIYIPLGGNRKGKIRKTINILITFIISGIWHGAGLNFIIWGLWHGLWNSIGASKTDSKVKLWIGRIGTFLIVMLGWIIFALPDMKTGIEYIKRMFFGFKFGLNQIISSVLPFTNDYSCFAYLVILILLIALLFGFEIGDEINNSATGKIRYGRMAVYIAGIVIFGTFGQNSFIYANF